MRRDALVLPLDRLLEALPRLVLDTERAARLCAGQSIEGVEVAGECARAYDGDGHLLGVVGSGTAFCPRSE